MTKKEFTQRVAIALAGNPKFTTFNDFSVANITEKAERLANYFESESNYGDFDDCTDGELIQDALVSINNQIWSALEAQKLKEKKD
jgi:hypothetical protein